MNKDSKSKESVLFGDNRFESLLLYIETTSNLKCKKDKIRTFLLKNNYKYTIDLNNTYFQNHSNYNVINGKKEIKSKWNDINNRTIKKYNYKASNIKIIEVIKRMYELCDERDSINTLFYKLVNNIRLSFFNYNNFLLLINEYFSKNIYYSLCLNSFFIRRLFEFNNHLDHLRIQSNQVSCVTNILKYFKERNMINNLNIMYDKLNGMTFKLLVDKYMMSCTKVKSLFYNGLQVLINYIESDIGLSCLLSLLKNNYINITDIKNVFGEYCNLIVYVLKLDIFISNYSIRYYEEYNGFFTCCFNDMQIIGKNKLITIDEYNEIANKIISYFKSLNVKIPINHVYERLNKIYKIYEKGLYYKGYISIKDKYKLLTRNYHFKNQDDLELLYFNMFGCKYNGRLKIIDNDGVLIVLAICESYRSDFSINEIIKELHNINVSIDKKEIKKIIIKSKMYYQINDSRFIGSDRELIEDLILKYKIKNKRCVKRIMNCFIK